jgi:hypothetical protein
MEALSAWETIHCQNRPSKSEISARTEGGHPFQQKWITKLIGYDFTMEYKKGVKNRVADALSRRDDWEPEITISLLSIPTVSWLKDLKAEYETDVQLKTLLDQWRKGELDSKKFFLRDELLFYKRRIYIGSS